MYNQVDICTTVSKYLCKNIYNICVYIFIYIYIHVNTKLESLLWLNVLCAVFTVLFRTDLDFIQPRCLQSATTHKDVQKKECKTCLF